MSLQSFIEKNFKKNRDLVKRIKTFAMKFGFNLEYWHRYVSYKNIKEDIHYSMGIFELFLLINLSVLFIACVCQLWFVLR